MFVADSPEEEAEEYKKIGNESYKKLDYEKAIENYSKAIELQPGAKEYYSNRVLTLFKLSRYEEALADCDSIRMLDSEWPKGLHLRGLALQQLGKNREAKSEFERLLQIDPNHKRAKERLAVIHATLEKDGNHTTEAGESRATTSSPMRSKKKSKKAKQKNTNKEKKTDSQLQKQIENLRSCNGRILGQLQEERAQSAKWKKKFENLEKQKNKKGGNKKNKNQGDGGDSRENVRLTKLLEESEGKRKELEDENMNLRQQLNKFQGKKISKWNAEALFDMIELHTNKLQTLNAESRRRFSSTKKSSNSGKRKG